VFNFLSSALEQVVERNLRSGIRENFDEPPATLNSHKSGYGLGNSSEDCSVQLPNIRPGRTLGNHTKSSGQGFPFGLQLASQFSDPSPETFRLKQLSLFN
jgi:hypothetical protein